jgi:dTDP-4-dehydrorhamnose reductase
MSKKLLILGSQGTLGQVLIKEFIDNGYKVTAWDRNDLDITSPEASEKILNLAPEIIINATGYNAVDKIETEEESTIQQVMYFPGIKRRDIKNPIFQTRSTNMVNQN